ncbi:MAG: hypothetical protein AAGH15_11280 [Myxococcota bacterium]
MSAAGVLPSELLVAHEEPCLRVVHARNVQVAVWRDAPTVERLDAMCRATGALNERVPGQSALLNLISGGRPSFPSELRQAAVERSASAVHPQGVAHVILLPGLIGADVRAFLGTIIALSRPPDPTRVFGALGDAVGWMAGQLTASMAPTWTASELEALARRCLDPRDPLATPAPA